MIFEANFKTPERQKKILKLATGAEITICRMRTMRFWSAKPQIQPSRDKQVQIYETATEILTRSTADVKD